MKHIANEKYIEIYSKKLLLFFLQCHFAALDRDLSHCFHVLQALRIQELFHVLLVSIRLLLRNSCHIDVICARWPYDIIFCARHGHSRSWHPSLVTWSQRLLFLIEWHLLSLAVGLGALTALLWHLLKISLLTFFTGQSWEQTYLSDLTESSYEMFHCNYKPL